MHQVTFTPANVPKYNACPVSSLDFERTHGINPRELYEEAFRKTAEQFGANSLAYKIITNGINLKTLTGSNFFWNNVLNSYLPKGKRVMTIADMEGIFAKKSDYFAGHYADTTQGLLRTNITERPEKKRLISNLSRQLKKEGIEYSPENPLIISGIKIVPDKRKRNEGYGLLFDLTDATYVNDSRFAYTGQNPRKEKFGGVEKNLWTIENDLVGLYLDGSLGLYSDVDDLADSNGSGWVVVVSDSD